MELPANLRNKLAFVADRAVDRILKPPARWACMNAATLYRRLLRDTTFIGITGSCGKTTTKNLLAGILATRHGVTRNPSSRNRPSDVARTLLRTRPSHAFCVQEVGAIGPGTLDRLTRLLQPDVGVVTNVMLDHYSAFRGKEAVAEEKVKLVSALPPDGLAVLNRDDPYVWAMRDQTSARVVSFGESSEAAFRIEEVRSSWPERFRCTIVHEGQRAQVVSQLCGEHWGTSILSAVATAVSLGMALDEAASAVALLEPEPARMCPVEADGITFIDDTWKASLDSVSPGLEFMRDASARRKVAVLGTLSDYAGTRSRKYRDVARQALEVADQVVFVGELAHTVLKYRPDPEDETLLAFSTMRETDAFLGDYLEPGDLVYLKASSSDHMERLTLSRTHAAACWRERCGVTVNCRRCRLLTKQYLPPPTASL